MKLWDFGRIKDGKVRIGDKIRRRLGFEDGCQIYSTLFRYDHNGNHGYEIVLSTFGPENYRELCSVTFYMVDVPGACAQAAKFLADRNVDILNSTSLSMTTNVSMVWKMLVDLSYYGDSTQLMEEFTSLKRTSSSLLSKIDTMEVETSHVSDRYAKGISGHHGSSIKAKALRKVSRSPTTIENGEFAIPKDYLVLLPDAKEGTPVMMVADTDSWVLSIGFMPENVRIVEVSTVVPDRPGAIFHLLDGLAQHDVNLLSVSSKVLVYGQRMTLDLVADFSKCAKNAEGTVDQVLNDLNGEYVLRELKDIDI